MSAIGSKANISLIVDMSTNDLDRKFLLTIDCLNYYKINRIRSAIQPGETVIADEMREPRLLLPLNRFIASSFRWPGRRSTSASRAGRAGGPVGARQLRFRVAAAGPADLRRVNRRHLHRAQPVLAVFCGGRTD